MTARKPSAAQRAVAAGHDGRCRRIGDERDSWLCVFGCPALLALQTDPEAVLVEVATPAGRGEVRRATLAPMSSPTLDAFTAAFYQAMIHNPDPEKQPRWEALTPAEQATRREQAKGALLYIGAPYAAGPTDPPPTEPAP